MDSTESAVDGPGFRATAVTIEYYQPAFALIYRDCSKLLRNVISSGREELIRSILRRRLGRYSQRVTWDRLYPVLEDIEAEIAKLLRTRSIVFWLHLYRRIGIALMDEGGASADIATTTLVRDIVESAIQKYGQISSDSDFGSSEDVDPRAILGGWFLRGVEALDFDQAARDAYVANVVGTAQLVILDFTPEDLGRLYRVESLAYEYWRTTAKLRAIGKGGVVHYSRSTGLTHQPDEAFRRLIEAYDYRNGKFGQFAGSALGVWFEPKRPKLVSDAMMSFYPSFSDDEMRCFFSTLDLELQQVVQDAPTRLFNYAFGLIDVTKFIDAHSFILDEFESSRGYPLEAIVSVLQTLNLSLLNISGAYADAGLTKMQSLAISLLSLCKRAYVVKDKAGFTLLRSACAKSLAHKLSVSEVEASRLIERILEALTLSASTRPVISLWTRGPRFPLVKAQDAHIVDFYGVARYLHNAFVGVKEESKQRGYRFEDAFRQALSDAGFCLERREFTFLDGSKAEADAVFYLGSDLIVVDCLSMWMPLDYEISRPKTMAYRRPQIEEKVARSLRRVEKLKSNSKGRNFDFTGANRIVAVVASPFVEWLWDESAELWIDARTPRVMSANELLSWAASQRG